jgi:hypothetical protein
MHRVLIALSLLFILGPAAHAQLNVSLDIKRRTFFRYEPLLATVTIQNLSGRDLTLEDGSSPWFGFTVLQGDTQTLLPPRNPDYQNDPFEVKINETVKRTVNLTQLFPLNEFGTHRIRANIYCKQLDKYFTTRTMIVDISEGRTVWKQVVGVPDTLPNAGKMHEITLLSGEGLKHQYLYCRITEPETGKVLCMNRIGHMIDGAQFDTQFDATNTLHVLQLAGPKTYSVTQVGVNGEMFGQWTYDAPKTRPRLRRDATGNIEIIGGVRRVEAAKNATPAPKLSDRPAGLPSAR